MNCPICRAKLPAGSRFCNACGASIGGSAPQGDRTLSYPAPPQPPPAAAPPSGYTAPGYNPSGSAPYSPPVPTPRKKPVALLAALITVVLVGVGGATVALVKGRQSAVTAGLNGSGLPGNPVTEVASGALPPGPGVTNAATPTPAPGKPVTASPNLPKPKPGDDMAPGLTFGGGTTNTGSSVTAVPNIATPTAPPLTMTPNATPPRGQRVDAAPNRPAPRGNPVTAAPQPQAPNNDAVFDRYLKWLEFVEGERQKMSAIQANMQQAQIKEFYDMIFAMSDPNAGPEVDQRAMRMPQQKMAEFAEVQRRVGIFWQNILRTKPPVPEDCKFLDGFYTEAARQCIIAAQEMQVALPRMDMGSIKSAGARMNVVNANLKRANQELEKVRDVRRLPFTWSINQEGGGGGGMGGLGGMGLGL